MSRRAARAAAEARLEVHVAAARVDMIRRRVRAATGAVIDAFANAETSADTALFEAITGCGVEPWAVRARVLDLATACADLDLGDALSGVRIASAARQVADLAARLAEGESAAYLGVFRAAERGLQLAVAMNDAVRLYAAAVDEQAGLAARPVGRPLRIIMATAVRVLPAAERPRWLEEFQAELADLNRWRRLPCTLRLLAHAIPLRRSLRRQRLGSPAGG